MGTMPLEVLVELGQDRRWVPNSDSTGFLVGVGALLPLDS